MTPAQRAEAVRLLAEGLSVAEVARRTGVSRNTARLLRDELRTAQPAAQSEQPRSAEATVVLHLTERELTALAFHLQTSRLGGPLTIEAWVNRIAGQVARQVLRNLGQGEEEPTVVVALPGKVPHAPRCPRCGGPVLIDQAGRRCINRGCTA